MWFNPVILVRQCKFWSHPWQIRAHWTCTTAQFQQVDLSFDLGPTAWAVPSSILHCQSQTHEDRGISYTPLKFWKWWKSDQHQESKEVLFDLFGGNPFPYELQKTPQCRQGARSKTLLERQVRTPSAIEIARPKSGSWTCWVNLKWVLLDVNDGIISMSTQDLVKIEDSEERLKAQEPRTLHSLSRTLPTIGSQWKGESVPKNTPTWFSNIESCCVQDNKTCSQSPQKHVCLRGKKTPWFGHPGIGFPSPEHSYTPHPMRCLRSL